MTEVDLNALKLLVEIIDAGSLSAAAVRNRISRSAVSHRLKILETSLGVQLLRRTTRKLQPTEIGRRLYDHGRTIVAELAEVRAEASSAGKSPRGSVRLSIPTGLGDAIVAGLLIEFKRLFPQVELDVLFENRIFDLLADEVDVAVRIMSSPPDSLHALDLGRVDWVVCCAPAYLDRVGRPTRLEQLSALDIVCSTAVGRKLSVSATQGRERSVIDVQPTLRSENFQFLKNAVTAGLGVGIFPFYQVEGDIASGRLVALLTQYSFSVFGRRAILLAVPDRFRTAASGALIDFLRVRVRKEMDALAKRFVAARLAPRSASR